MKELLRELMDRGFLIYRYETDLPSSSMLRPKFVLKKVGTPADNRSFDLGDGDDELVEHFASFEEALDKAKEMIDWKDVKEEVKQVTQEPHLWVAELMYRHVLGPQFEDLGEIDNLSYKEAMSKAKELAESYITEYLEEDKIDGWDVRVRLCNR